MMSRMRVTVVSPDVPSPLGSGSPIRLEAILREMAKLFDVDLLLVSFTPVTNDELDFMRSLGVSSVREVPGPFLVVEGFAKAERMPPGEARYQVLSTLPVPETMKLANATLAESICSLLGDRAPDALHIFQSNLLLLGPMLRDLIAARYGQLPYTVVDLNDIETDTALRLADIQSDHGSHAEAREARLRAALADRVYAERLPDFDAVCVCSNLDREKLAGRYEGVHVRTLSNLARLGDVAVKPKFDEAELNILFVGMLSYFPNIDAVEILTRIILPAVRNRTNRKVRLDIVGRGASPVHISRWASAGARVHDSPEDLSGFYDQAHVVLVPIRSGGGTRIKILEAFSMGVPVISSAVGAEGLEVTDGESILFADTLEQMVDLCIAVAEDPELRERLTSKGREVVAGRYSPASLLGELRSVYSPILQDRVGFSPHQGRGR